MTADGYEQHIDLAEMQIGSDGQAFVTLLYRYVYLRLYYQPRLLLGCVIDRNRQHLLRPDVLPGRTWAQRLHLATDGDLATTGDH